jgi:hypothetical protein
MWFVDKLGPAPGTQQTSARANGAARTQAAAPPRGQSAKAGPAKSAPPEPEKKKKKGWF